MARIHWLLVAAALIVPAAASANTVTDWDEMAVGWVQPRMAPPFGYRVMAMMHIAMFEAVNSVEHRYAPYRAALPAAPEVSKEAAAASAAGEVLAKLVPEAAGEIGKSLDAYLASIPEGTSKSEGIRLGADSAAAILALRADDGSSAADAYRPKTRPGQYVPTAITVGSMFPNVTPFAMTKPSQFRPKPPVALKSAEWARDYNEIKALGAKASAQRTAKQTEDARFWVLTGPLSTHPLIRQIAIAKSLSLIDSARLMTLASIAEADAMVAVMDAKYKYEFWRPITAIRNGDISGNPSTERDATWQPIDSTPLHPEYPCAHCIVSSSVASALKAVLGSSAIPEVSMTSPMAPGVVHRWTDLDAYAAEVAEARIFAGFHYRFSTVVGREMGRKLGAYVVRTVLLPAQS